jgi:hypothetical protein
MRLILIRYKKLTDLIIKHTRAKKNILYHLITVHESLLNEGLLKLIRTVIKLRCALLTFSNGFFFLKNRY